MTQTLVSYDFLAIKQFVFATDRLKDIRGGSAALDYLNRKAIPDAVRNVDPNAQIIYSAGGTGLISTTLDCVAKVSDACHKSCRDLTETAQLKTAHLTLPEGNLNLEASLKKLASRLQIEKRRNVRCITVPTHSLMLPCESCGDHYASEVNSSEGKDVAVCRACKIRVDFDRDIRRATENGQWLGPWENLETALNNRGASLIGRQRAESFEELCGSGLLALIYADGDDLGNLFDRSSTLSEVKKRSAAIEEALSAALADAVLPDLRNTSSVSLPFDVIFMGGDDLVLATTPAAAFRIAIDVAKGFARYATSFLGHSASLSIGIAIAPSTYPFRQLLDDSLETLKSAKTGRFIAQRGGHNTGGFINYVISGETKQTISKSALRATLRPYTIERLEQLVAVLPMVSKLPSSKLEALRSTAFMNKSEATFKSLITFARMPDKQRNLFHDVMNDLSGTSRELVWIKADNEWLNPWSDLIDLLEFIGTESEMEGNG